MRKAHVKVTLDVLVHADDAVDITHRLSEIGFTVNENDSYDMDVVDVTVTNAEVTDSR